jgi:hypothetical protein
MLVSAAAHAQTGRPVISAYLLIAALSFAVGGLFMKLAATGRPYATGAFLVLFVVGPLLQARAMRRADMGPVDLARPN